MFGKAETIEPSAFSNTRVIRTPYLMVEYKIRADILLIARIFSSPHPRLGKIFRNSQNIRAYYVLNYRI